MSIPTTPTTPKKDEERNDLIPLWTAAGAFIIIGIIFFFYQIQSNNDIHSLTTLLFVDITFGTPFLIAFPILLNLKAADPQVILFKHLLIKVNSLVIAFIM